MSIIFDVQKFFLEKNENYLRYCILHANTYMEDTDFTSPQQPQFSWISGTC